MNGNERIEKFLELQNKNINIDDIAKEIGITTRTLKSFLTKNGYKLENGKYVPKEMDAVGQIEFMEVPVGEKKTTRRNTKTNQKDTKTIEKDNKETKKTETKGTNASTRKTTNSAKTKNTTKTTSNVKATAAEKKSTKTTPKPNTKTTNKQVKKTTEAQKTAKVNNTKPKKDRKINLTQEDMDKLCEVYDWYLEVKDNKSIKPKKAISKKDINIEEKNLKDLKSTSIRVDKSTWEDFERLCSNSEFTKQEIITQALKNFMKEYKHLL
ncbi:MAG: DNA-binding protein [Peptostreptococcaceae bacterium]